MVVSSTATSTASIVPASRLAVVCNYETRSVLQELIANAATAHDGTGAGDVGNGIINVNQSTSSTIDWGGMAGGALESCDDWDRHQVVVIDSSSPELPSQIYSRNSVARAVTSDTGASSSSTPMSDGFGFAVWLTLPNGTSTHGLGGDGMEEEAEAPVLTLGRPMTAPSDDATIAIPKWKECGELYDLELSYRPAFREFVLRYSDADGTAAAGPENVTTLHDQASNQICRTLRIAVNDILGPASTTFNDTDIETYASMSTLHLAVMWTAQPPTLNVYGQGRAVLVTPLPQPLNVTLSQWNADEDHLVLFREGSFGGGLHQADFFLAPNLPDSDQIATLYQQGFVKAQYHLLNNRTGGSKNENAWVQLFPLKAPPDASRRIAQDATSSLMLPLGGMVRWKRNISAFYSSVSSLPDDAELGRRFGLWVNITRLPTYGKLSMSNSSSVIDRVGSVLVLPLPIEQVSAATLELDYTLTDRDFYNLPARQGSTLDDSERLEAAISVIWKGEVISSSPVVIPIQIQQVNSRPPVLTAPASLVVAPPNSSFLFNVSLHDPDSGSASTPVRVDVTSKHSSLTLALNGDDELSFVYNECRQRSESPWQCLGGEREGAMAGRVVTFVAPMENVARILSTKVRVNLVQESDTISIRVYDGQDGMNCLSAREHAMYGSNWTLHRGCFEVDADVELMADPSAVKAGATSGGVPDTSSISRVANLLFWSLTLLLVVGIVACLRRCMPRCLAGGSCLRRGAIDADDGVDTPHGEESDVSSPVSSHQKVKDVENGSPETLDTTISDDEFDDVASF
jgi:hypothetical protein